MLIVFFNLLVAQKKKGKNKIWHMLVIDIKGRNRPNLFHHSFTFLFTCIILQTPLLSLSNLR